MCMLVQYLRFFVFEFRFFLYNKIVGDKVHSSIFCRYTNVFNLSSYNANMNMDDAEALDLI